VVERRSADRPWSDQPAQGKAAPAAPPARAAAGGDVWNDF